MDHLWGSITCLGSALDALHGRVCGVEQDVGDLAKLLDEYNLVDLSEGLMRALGQVAPWQALTLSSIFKKRLLI
jgi:hypothetical protein